MTYPAALDFDLTQWDEAEACYHLGYQQACADLAARTIELHATWAPIGRTTRAQRIADDLAAMKAAGDRISAELGRPVDRPGGYTYRGGPVDWHTGRPLTTPWQAHPPTAVAA